MHHPHSPFLKRTAEYAGSATYVNWKKSLDPSNICCQSSRISYTSILGTSFSQNLMLVCNTIHLSLMKKVKTSVPLSHHLVGIWECIAWSLNLPDTLHLDDNPLNYAYICELLQQQDNQLLALQVKYPDNYVNPQLDDDDDDIICYKKDPTQPNLKILLPELIPSNGSTK
jgi:hypothetical protein